MWGVLIGLLTPLLIIIGGPDTPQSFVVLGLPTSIMCVVCTVGLVVELERRPVLRTEAVADETMSVSQQPSNRNHAQAED
nr:hypothetical protein [Halocatena marina]